MTEQRTSAAQREMLRQRYLVNPGTLSCFVCREAMELLPPERDKIGVLWTWCCPRASEHSSLRYIDHYADLDVIDAVDDADALAGALVEIARLRTTCGDALAALRAGYRSPHPLDFYLGADPEMHDYVEGRDAARAANLLDDALACTLGQSDGGK